jgi:hypothetical protein
MPTFFRRTTQLVLVFWGLSIPIPPPVAAALVAVDTPLGAGTATLDTIADRQWLDLSLTRPLSFNDVTSELGPGGQFEGFQVGSSSDVFQLVNNSGLLTAAPADAFMAFQDAISLFAGTVDDRGFENGCVLAVYGVVSDLVNPGERSAAGFLNQGVFPCDEFSFNLFDVAGFGRADTLPIETSSDVVLLSGAWLFRVVEVPAPGTIELAVLGLLVLVVAHSGRVFQTRRRRALRG